jgi:hypothetical protein
MRLGDRGKNSFEGGAFNLYPPLPMPVLVGEIVQLDEGWRPPHRSAPNSLGVAQQ